jgi:septal ring factor EnvC (AmiA/AmiB activator)
LLLFCLSLAGPATAGEEPDLKGRESELDQVRNRIGQLKGELSSSETRQQALMKELQATEERIGQTGQRLRMLAGRLQQQRARLAALEKQQQRQQNRLDLQRQALAQQLRAAYAMGRQERLKILLNQQDPAVVSRMMVYYDYFNRARTEQMARIGDMLERLRGSAKEIADEEQRLLALQARELEQRQRLEQTRELRQQVVTVLNQEIKNKGQQLSRLVQDARRLQNVIKELQEQLVNLPMEGVDLEPFKRMRGKLRWPVKGRIKARFGSRRAGNLKWDGVMISAPEGREIGAVYHGRVAFSDWLRGFGLLLIIDHGDGYMSLYGHNQSLFKEAGEWVETGEPVASAGNSGGHSSPGLYFAVRYKGNAVDPRKWCRRN